MSNLLSVKTKRSANSCQYPICSLNSHWLDCHLLTHRSREPHFRQPKVESYGKNAVGVGDWYVRCAPAIVRSVSHHRSADKPKRSAHRRLGLKDTIFPSPVSPTRERRNSHFSPPDASAASISCMSASIVSRGNRSFVARFDHTASQLIGIKFFATPVFFDHVNRRHHDLLHASKNGDRNYRSAAAAANCYHPLQDANRPRGYLRYHIADIASDISHSNFWKNHCCFT